MKKTRIGIIILVAILVIAQLLSVACVGGNQTKLDKIKDGDPTVTIEIECSSVLDNYDDLKSELRNEKVVPKDGIIVKEMKVLLKEGDTAYSILERVTMSKKIVIDVQESLGWGKYITTINNLGEKDCGEWSGWTYYINDEFPLYALDKTELKDGDKLNFSYVCKWEM